MEQSYPFCVASDYSSYVCSMKSRFWLHTGLPVAFFVGWAIAFSYPLALNLTHSVVLWTGGDVWQNLWNLWWVDKALVQLHHNPYVTNYILYPFGQTLYYHSLNLVNGLASIPLQGVFGLTTTFNLLALANLALDGLAAYWLCLDRTRNVGASLVGGAMFASLPLLGTSLDLGQLEELTAWWLPLYLLALLRALDASGPFWKRGGGRRAVVCASICLVGASLATWYFTAGQLILTAVFVPAYLLACRGETRRGEKQGKEDKEGKGGVRAWEAAGKIAAIGLLAALALSPLLVAMLRERLAGQTYMLPAQDAVIYNSADLLAPFFPTRLILGTPVGRTGNISLGYLPLALGLYALVRGRKQLWPLGLAAGVLTLLAFGPELRVYGNNTGLPMPYALFNSVPLLGALRQPLRLLSTSGLCLSLLSAYGLTYLSRAGLGRLAGKSLVPVTLALLGLEMFAIPRVLVSTDIGQAYNVIGAVGQSAEAGAVLEAPAAQWQARAMWSQTAHGRPLIGGYTSRHYPYILADSIRPGVSQLFRKDAQPLSKADILSPSMLDTALASLNYYGVRYVVAHNDDLQDPSYAPIASALRTLYLPSDAIYTDAHTTVYRTPLVGADQPFLALGDGWYDVEGSNATLHRWLGSSADVSITVPTGAAGRYDLSLEVYSYRTPRDLQGLLDGRQIIQQKIGPGPQTLHIALSLTPGEHNFTIKSVQPPEAPPGDNRELGLGLTRISLARIGS